MCRDHLRRFGRVSVRSESDDSWDRVRAVLGLKQRTPIIGQEALIEGLPLVATVPPATVDARDVES